MISLTSFIVWVTSTIKDCYHYAFEQEYEQLNLTKIPSNSSFYHYDEDYCYEILRNAVSQNNITTGNPGLRVIQLRHNLLNICLVLSLSTITKYDNDDNEDAFSCSELETAVLFICPRFTENLNLKHQNLQERHTAKIRVQTSFNHDESSHNFRCQRRRRNEDVL